jgi:hypothetical protein
MIPSAIGAAPMLSSTNVARGGTEDDVFHRASRNAACTFFPVLSQPQKPLRYAFKPFIVELLRDNRSSTASNGAGTICPFLSHSRGKHGTFELEEASTFEAK